MLKSTCRSEFLVCSVFMIILFVSMDKSRDIIGGAFRHSMPFSIDQT